MIFPAQDAETRLAKLEKTIAKAEEGKLKEKEEYQTLYEKASSEIESLSANAEKWSKYEEVKRNSLLENHPEDDRDSLSKLDLETLEYVTNKIINTKPNAPELVGNPRQKAKPIGNWAEMDADERRSNWGEIVKGFNKK